MSDSVDFPKLDTPFVLENESDPGAGRIIGIPWYRLLIALWNRTGGTSGNTDATIQPGFILPLAAGAIPSGYLACDGASYLGTNFPNLFAQIQYTFGGAAGTFNVPDYRDRTLIGGGVSYAVGSYGGAASHFIDVTELPSHNHDIIDPGHAHTQQVVSNNVAGVAGTQGGSAANNLSVGTTDVATTGITTNFTGNSLAMSLLPPYGAVKWIIKV